MIAEFLIGIVQVVILDLTLAGENAIAVGMAVAALHGPQRKKAMAVGIVAATALRIILAFFAVQLLKVTGLLAAGGLLLLWVAWKMAHDLHTAHRESKKPESEKKNKPPAKKFSEAIWQIVVADVSMSLDNVLGVAGIARDHMPTLVIGLIFSVALMGAASVQIAKLTEKYPRIAYVGVAIVLYTALSMMVDGAGDLAKLLPTG